MQHPYVLIALSVLFVTLAMSMFGVYNLQLPSSIQTWFNNQSNKQQGGNTLGVFAMGLSLGVFTLYQRHCQVHWLYVASKWRPINRSDRPLCVSDGYGYPADLGCGVWCNKLLPKAGS